MLGYRPQPARVCSAHRSILVYLTLRSRVICPRLGVGFNQSDDLRRSYGHIARSMWRHGQPGHHIASRGPVALHHSVNRSMHPIAEEWRTCGRLSEHGILPADLSNPSWVRSWGWFRRMRHRRRHSMKMRCRPANPIHLGWIHRSIGSVLADQFCSVSQPGVSEAEYQSPRAG